MLGPKIGHKRIHVRETDSTNSHASRLLHSSFPDEGTAIMAQFQKAGRGQGGSRWESAPGENLLVSFILYPEFIAANDHFLINEAVSLAVQETVHALCNKPAFIKWPNDIIVENSKIAGILIENTIRNDKIIQSITGIGLNINQLNFGNYFPKAISLKELTGKELTPDGCLDVLSSYLDKWYQILRTSQHERIRSAYADVLYRKNLMSQFDSGNGKITGIISGVSDNGQLMITTAEGKKSFFNNKEVKLLSF
ncbi:MAG TPA: biotin--[acetyl-CoA-carboxylase] ligase [Bacteroidia bacterium]|nr:biotin--[acetyl-CoA-carboxylase] ligase [Bacteroidia bacterium]